MLLNLVMEVISKRYSFLLTVYQKMISILMCTFCLLAFRHKNPFLGVSLLVIYFWFAVYGILCWFLNNINCICCGFIFQIRWPGQGGRGEFTGICFEILGDMWRNSCVTYLKPFLVFLHVLCV
jgi:hypothetical protein